VPKGVPSAAAYGLSFGHPLGHQFILWWMVIVAGGEM